MDDMRKGELLEVVLDRTQAVVAGVPAGSGDDPTPCTKWPVATLTRHMVGWAQAFAQVVATGEMPPGNPDEVEITDAGAQYRAAADQLVAAWRKGDGPDGQYAMMGSPMPGTFLYPMMLGEFVGHGWDLAKATGQPLTWPDEAATMALESMRAMVQPSMRVGPDAFVGEEVEVPADAPPLDKLVAFAGRDPNWTPPAA